MLVVSVSGYSDWKSRLPSARTLRHAWLAGCDRGAKVGKLDALDLVAAIHNYIEVWYNQRRRHSGLRMLTPTEFEDHHTTTIAG
jgi:transposase InsO family protein